MKTVDIKYAQSHLLDLIDEIADSREPLLIASDNSRAVLISENHWRSIQETMHLLSIPGMRESIVEGMNAPIESDFDSVEW